MRKCIRIEPFDIQWSWFGKHSETNNMQFFYLFMIIDLSDAFIFIWCCFSFIWVGYI